MEEKKWEQHDIWYCQSENSWQDTKHMVCCRSEWIKDTTVKVLIANVWWNQVITWNNMDSLKCPVNPKVICVVLLTISWWTNNGYTSIHQWCDMILHSPYHHLVWIWECNNELVTLLPVHCYTLISKQWSSYNVTSLLLPSHIQTKHL